MSRAVRLAPSFALLLALLSGCAAPDLLAERRTWWRTPHHALLVDDLRPLERVRGRGGTALPAGDPVLAQALQDAALEAIGPHRTAALLVWHGEALQLAYHGPGFDAAMLSAPASMPKPVLALAVGAAVDRGLLDIDAPVSRHLPEWRADPRGRITVRQALQMRSGLAKHGPASAGGAGEALMLGTRLADLVLATPLVRAPGEAFDYNNIDNALVALVLERATRTRYADWLSATIWQPIRAGEAFVWLDRPGGLARTFCCLLATPQDWVRIGRLVKDGGQWNGKPVLSAGWMVAMTAPSPGNDAYGFQLWRGTAAAARSYGSGAAPPLPVGAPYAVDDLLVFDGAGGQRVYISRKADLVIVRIGEDVPDWQDSRLPNAVIKVLRAPSRTPRSPR